MSEHTNIQWCDSTGNIQMGCEGCELVKGKKVPTCYAENLTKRYKGNKGWPDAFDKPKLFLERLPKILKWSDLTGKDRPAKPWLNGMPRLIFLNDMGDTFSNGMPLNWFANILPQLADSPHQFLVLTKWPQRFVELSKKFSIPKNVWPGTSVTSEKTLFRAKVLTGIKGGGPLWISGEPQWGQINYNIPDLEKYSWIVFGGESGPFAEPCDLDDMFKNIQLCYRLGIKPFVKQLGSKPMMDGKKLYQNDSKGGDMKEWPMRMRVREMPEVGITELMN